MEWEKSCGTADVLYEDGDIEMWVYLLRHM